MNGRILVGVDGSEGSRAALAWAVEEAARRASVVQAATVRPGPDDLSPQAYFPGDAPEVERVVLEGDPGTVLCERAAGADLLVVGSRGHGGLGGLMLGSVSAKCAHHSPVPVVIVRAGPRVDDPGEVRPAGVVVVGVDGSAGSRRALRYALREAEIRGAALRAVAVWRGTEVDDDMVVEWASVPSLARLDLTAAAGAKDYLRQALSEVEGDYDVEVEPLVLEGDPAEVLCRVAEAADMLVVGSRGHGGFAGLLLGSVSTKCAHHSPAPVVIVPTGRDTGPSSSQAPGEHRPGAAGHLGGSADGEAG